MTRKGWQGESHRHMLSSRGITSKVNTNKRKTNRIVDFIDDDINNQIKMLLKDEPLITREELAKILNDNIINDYNEWIETLIDENLDEIYKEKQIDWWKQLTEFWESGKKHVKVLTRQGNIVWINLDNPKGYGDIYSNRIPNFFGTSTKNGELGHYYDMEDIEMILTD